MLGHIYNYPEARVQYIVFLAFWVVNVLDVQFNVLINIHSKIIATITQINIMHLLISILITSFPFYKYFVLACMVLL